MSTQMRTDLAALLPPYYSQIADYQAICAAEQPTFDAISKDVGRVADNARLLRMDAAECALWEAVFGIAADPVRETLAFRRARVVNRISAKPPYTMEFLRRKLDELTGPGQCRAEMDYGSYILYIERPVQSAGDTRELEWTVEHIKPAHIVYLARPYLTGGVWISEAVSYVPRRWNYLLGQWALGGEAFSSDSVEAYHYALGSWALGAAPFKSYKEEKMAKPANVPSIRPPMLACAAAAVLDDITAVRINGAHEITALSKDLSGGACTVTCAVPESITRLIEREELLAADGTVLSAADVYIPVAGSVQLIFRLTVKEESYAESQSD